MRLGGWRPELRQTNDVPNFLTRSWTEISELLLNCVTTLSAPYDPKRHLLALVMGQVRIASETLALRVAILSLCHVFPVQACLALPTYMATLMATGRIKPKCRGINKRANVIKLPRPEHEKRLQQRLEKSQPSNRSMM